MESNEGEENGGYEKTRRWITKVIFFFSLLISIAGGSVLGWWLHKYHPTNSQLWMVPFGFVLFLTPLIVCLSVIIPDYHCVTKNNEEEAFKTATDHPVDHSLSQPKRS